MKPIPLNTVKEMERLGVKPGDPILIRIFKEESELEVWKQSPKTQRFIKVKSYDICRWSGVIGPKFQEGDRQAPEGFYHVTPALMNPNSSYHLSFNLGFPNAFDRSHGRTGSFLMVHGACSSAGCYAMNDPQIEEIYAIAREAFDAGQKYFQVQAFPFRMTPENLVKHRDHRHMPFWRMIKEGSDHFEATKRKPNVTVCNRRYVFNAMTGDYEFDSTSQCPDYEIDPDIRAMVEKKQRADLERERILLAELQGSEAAPVMPEPVAGQIPEQAAAAEAATTVDTVPVPDQPPMRTAATEQSL